MAINRANFKMTLSTLVFSICKNFIDLHLLLMERFKNRLHSEYIMNDAYICIMYEFKGFSDQIFFSIQEYK